MSAQVRLLVAQLLVVLPLAIVTWIAIAESLYWRFWWFDIPMHFAGGLWAGLCAAWIRTYRNERFSIMWCLVFALVIGIGWEIFEYSEGIAGGYHINYHVDTLKDIVFDLLGAAAAYVVARSLVRERMLS